MFPDYPGEYTKLEVVTFFLSHWVRVTNDLGLFNSQWLNGKFRTNPAIGFVVLTRTGV